MIHCDTATYCNNISHITLQSVSTHVKIGPAWATNRGFAGDLSMDGLNEMMDFMDAFTLSSNAQEGTKDLGGGRFLMFFSKSSVVARYVEIC